MTERKDFCHDEIIISDVNSPETNWYRLNALVPSSQVDNFLYALVRTAKSNSQDPPLPEEVARLLMHVVWEEFAHRSNLRVTTHPVADLTACPIHLKSSTEFTVCLEGALYPPCSLDFLDQLQIPFQVVKVDDCLVDQEISNQKVLLGTELPFEYPIQRGDTLEGKLVITDSENDNEILNRTGLLTVPLVGDHLSFDRIVFDNDIGLFLESLESEISWNQECHTKYLSIDRLSDLITKL